MKGKKVQFALVLALAALLLSSFSVFAYPAENPNVDPLPSGCARTLANEAALAKVDIPAHRADYNIMDRVGSCLVVDAVSVSIPVTGLNFSRFQQFKDQQADQRMGQ